MTVVVSPKSKAQAVSQTTVHPTQAVVAFLFGVPTLLLSACQFLPSLLSHKISSFMLYVSQVITSYVGEYDTSASHCQGELVTFIVWVGLRSFGCGLNPL